MIRATEKASMFCKTRFIGILGSGSNPLIRLYWIKK